MGPGLFLMLHFMQQATSELAWGVTADWERHIPVRDFATLGTFLDRLKNKDIVNTDNAVALLSRVGRLSQRALEEGIMPPVKQALARAGLLTQLAVEAQTAGLLTTEDFAVLPEIEGEPLDFTLRSRRLTTGDDPTPIAGIVQPVLADEIEAEALSARLSQADNTLKGQKRAPELLVAVVEQAGEASLTALCAQVHTQRTHAFVVLVANGRVACHSAQSEADAKLLGAGRDATDLAQQVCNLEVTLCEDEPQTNTSSSGREEAGSPSTAYSASRQT